MDTKKTVNNIIKITTIVFLCTLIAFVIYSYKIGLFASEKTFQDFVAGFGLWAVLIFILIQAVSVVVSVLPTSIGVVVGAIIFTPSYGFLYNYIGICVGSIIAFLLSRKYGKPFVKGIVGRKFYDKYIGWVDEGKKFNRMFAAAIFFPVAPDDILCYIAGLTKMKFKEFTLIILLGKPVSLLVYSYGFIAILHFVMPFIK